MRSAGTTVIEHGHRRGRPPEVWAMVLMTLVGAGLCLVAAVRPPTTASPVAVNAVLAAVGVVLASRLWWPPPVSLPPLLHVAAGVNLLGATVIVAKAATGEGAMSAAVSYIWVSMYATAFFPARTARTYAAMSALALWLALLVNDNIVSAFAAWMVVVVTLVVGVEMLSGLLARMRAMAIVDQLTGLWNRGALSDALPREQAMMARSGQPLTLAVIDVNDFKGVNDRDGHVAGDRLLVALAQEWRAGIRPTDLVFRYGGDEFVLLLPRTSQEQARTLLQRLQRKSVASWSYGVGPVNPDDTLDDCLARADRLMYEQKAARAAAAGSP